MTPKPDDEAESHYRGDSGRRYFEGRLDGTLELGRQYQARHFAPYCSPTTAVLDIGCGDGTILRHLPASQKVGIELNPLCHERIAQRNHNEDVPVSVFSRLSDLPTSEPFDVAISNHCLEHVRSPLALLEDIHGRLKDDGRLVVVVPFDDWRDNRQRRWRPQDKDNHFYTWSPLSLGNMVTAAGFDVLETQAVRSAWSPRLFWIHQRFGPRAFDLACKSFARIRQLCEVRCVARRGTPPTESP